MAPSCCRARRKRCRGAGDESLRTRGSGSPTGATENACLGRRAVAGPATYEQAAESGRRPESRRGRAADRCRWGRRAAWGSGRSTSPARSCSRSVVVGPQPAQLILGRLGPLAPVLQAGFTARGPLSRLFVQTLHGAAFPMPRLVVVGADNPV